jgi:hypothetical protein
LRTVLLAIFLSSVAGLSVGWLLRRSGWSRAWIVIAVANLVLRFGVVVVFVSVSVAAFRHGGLLFFVIGVLVALLALVSSLVYAIWAVAIFGSERAISSLARHLPGKLRRARR